jgi:hypothetical protein
MLRNIVPCDDTTIITMVSPSHGSMVHALHNCLKGVQVLCIQVLGLLVHAILWSHSYGSEMARQSTICACIRAMKTFS